MSFRYCCSTTPMAMSDASVITLIAAPGLGCTRSVALAKASLIALKEVMAAVFHCRVRLLAEVVFSNVFSGTLRKI